MKVSARVSLLNRYPPKRRGLAAAILAISLLCNCDAVGRPRASERRGNAAAAPIGQMTDFISKTLQWTGDERPALAISRGLILAWLPDPSTSLPPNPATYYLNTPERRIVVAPGVPLLILPSRREGSGDRTRLTGTQYQLAVTQDGFWGVVDTAQSNSIIEELDLRKMVDLELSQEKPDSLFGILVQTSYQIPGGLPVSLSRGEVFRIISDSASDRIKIAFDSDIVHMRTKQSDIADLAKKLSKPVPSSFVIDSTKVRMIDIKISGNLVRDDLIKDWRVSQGHYQEIFNDTFSSLRWPSEVQLNRGCDTKVVIKSSTDTEAEVKADAELSVSAKLLKFFDAKLGLSASGRASAKQSVEKTTTVEPLVNERLHLIEYKERNAPEKTFWVGTAKICAAPSWSTIMVRNGDDERFLHASFYTLTKDKEVPIASDEVHNLLKQLKPGGNPWDASGATFLIGCSAQELQLEDLSLNRMGNPSTPLYQIKSAIVLSSFLKMQNAPRAMRKFIGSDADCVGSSS